MPRPLITGAEIVSFFSPQPAASRAATRSASSRGRGRTGSMLPTAGRGAAPQVDQAAGLTDESSIDPAASLNSKLTLPAPPPPPLTGHVTVVPGFTSTF